MFVPTSRILVRGKFVGKNIKNMLINNMNTASCSSLKFETLEISTPTPFVYHVQLNRPKKMNAINNTMWLEIGNCFQSLGDNPDCRAIVLTGNGNIFCSGIDLMDMMEWGPKLESVDGIAQKCKFLRSKIECYQNSLTSLEKCSKPVIAAVHNACIGGAFDLIVAADIRYCTKDAWFQIKEVDLGLAADVGTLQRLPKVIGSESLTRELCFTARKLPAAEALQCGLVSKICEDKDSLVKDALKVAETIAKKSPVAVQGTKISIIYARDHSVQEGLDQVKTWNSTMLQSEDLVKAAMGQMTKDENVTFSKL